MSNPSYQFTHAITRKPSASVIDEVFTNKKRE